MKMLAFLRWELSNAELYFTTFANANKKDCKDMTKSFSIDGSKSWKPFDYEKRLSDATLVIAKKKKLSTKTVTQPTRRSKLTALFLLTLKAGKRKFLCLGNILIWLDVSLSILKKAL